MNIPKRRQQFSKLDFSTYKTSILLLLVCFLTTISWAQNGINYKAVIKDANGNVMANRVTAFRFAILKGSQTGSVEYQETIFETTDANGLVITNIGTGDPLIGTFEAIDWAGDTHFLNVQISLGNGLIDMGTTEFAMVPYANTSSRISESPSRTLEIAGTGPQNLRLNSKNNNSTGLEFLSSGISKDWKIETSGLYLDIKVSDDDFASSEGKFTFRNNGRLGVNTISPTTELDVDGSIRTRDLAGTGIRPVSVDAQGDLVVDTTPKTHYLSIHHSAFSSSESNARISIFSVMGPNLTNETLFAPVNLPDGAIIKMIKVYFRDNSTENIDFYLQKYVTQSATVSTIVLMTTSGMINDVRNLESNVLSELVNNQTTSYSIRAQANWVTSQTALSVRTIIITYELP